MVCHLCLDSTRGCNFSGVLLVLKPRSARLKQPGACSNLDSGSLGEFALVFLKIRWSWDVKCAHGSTSGPKCFLTLIRQICELLWFQKGDLEPWTRCALCNRSVSQSLPYSLPSFFLRTTDFEDAIDCGSLGRGPVYPRLTPEPLFLLLFRNWQLSLKDLLWSLHTLVQSLLVACSQTK